MKDTLSIKTLIAEAELFCRKESKFQNKALYGVTDGKAVGTYIEHKFQDTLSNKYCRVQINAL